MESKALHLRRLAFFLVLSLADLGLTWQLLRAGGSSVYESNPIANWFLRHHGWLGLGTFKVANAVAVAALAWVISLYRPQTGARVLSFGCAVLMGVVAYSWFLPRLTGVRVVEEAREEYALRAINRVLEDRIRVVSEHIELKNRLVEEVLARECSLAEAVNRLKQSDKGQDATWHAHLRRLYPGLELDECFAANLIHACHRHAARGRPTSPRISREELAAMFQVTYHKPLPAQR